jgi:hypothetical protein
MTNEQCVLDAISDLRTDLGERLARVETRLDEWDKRAIHTALAHPPAPAPTPEPAPARGAGAGAVAGGVSAGLVIGFFEGLRRLFS